MQLPDREQQIEYNLTVLKRRDAAIIKILDMAGHVVLYQFNEDSKAWDRKGVEGSLFVVERSTEPRYQFVVLNRLSSENLIETVDADFQTELTDQFLLYRNLKQEILGVWFYSPPERTAISDLLDMDKLKAKLAGQLRGLLDDDGFLTLLANEYLRQQQRALQQAQQARQRKEAATTSASTPTDAVAASLPAHLASLMQSAGLK